ncbi:MAG: helix-turn-helix transcriptional regulator [Eubacteriales bacterium]|nr:helix-turn-helix transcriptional regulator [Eubacteriales bacterium]
MNSSIFASNVKYFRESVLRISQEKLAEKVGVGQHTISEYERGKNSNPTLNVLSDLADVFGISVSQLLSCDYQAGGYTSFAVRQPNGSKEVFSYFEGHVLFMYFLAVGVSGTIREATLTFDQEFDKRRKYLHGSLNAGHEYDCKMVIEGNTTNATVYINGIGKTDERRINIAFFYPASKNEDKFPGSIGVIVRLDDNNTLKGQRVILSAEKLDYENNREAMLGYLTNDDKNHDVYIDRYNVSRFLNSIEKLK